MILFVTCFSDLAEVLASSTPRPFAALPRYALAALPALQEYAMFRSSLPSASLQHTDLLKAFTPSCFADVLAGFALDLSLSRDVLTQARGSAEAAVLPLRPIPATSPGTLTHGLVIPAGCFAVRWRARAVSKTCGGRPYFAWGCFRELMPGRYVRLPIVESPPRAAPSGHSPRRRLPRQLCSPHEA